ncbi:M16 family metallopeptidase [Ornithinimicrobium pekingense]|uniref:Peptidase M16 n=1 Tax=Ornithinimicrobium pekingense TaxID=384677 RepID=A0ABQ2F756_9MICO|nr:pitrilysin family protein [Ornithinimicrobium pekingense]GGK65424.1 peptidase M16 [Ornithinimicrobium pekingense]
MSGRVLERPAVRPPQPWAFPVPRRTHLSNGMRLLVVDMPGQHVLSLRVNLRLPVSHEEPGTEGSTLLMARALDEGTSRHTSEELAELAERNGIAWGAGAGERGVHLGLEVTARHLGTAVALLTECLAEAAFPDAEVARLARHRLADIAHDEADPGSRAALEFVRTYYHEDDRPHLPLGGTRETVSSLTPEHLRARHGQLSPRGATAVLVGDLSTVPGAVSLLGATLGTWQGSGDLVDLPGPARRADGAGRTVLVPRPGLAQTEIYLGRPGPDRRTRHGWGTFQTLGMLLGGSPHARIDRVLREERGYTYGMRAGFRPRAVGGLTVVGGSVRADATVDALRELRVILDTPGVDLTEREVREAADFLSMTAPGRYGTADAVADEIVALVSDGLEPATVTETLAQLRDLTAARVGQAWDEVRTGPPWTLVLVGDPAHLDGAEELGFGPVSVVG